MKIYHITRRRLRWMGVLAVLMVLTVPILAGCFNKDSSNDEAIVLSTVEEQVTFLASLGWEVDPAPIETLDLQLPQQWDEEWTAYAAMQTKQGLPFADFAGAVVHRVTYTVKNYPHIADGVQLNLYVADGQLIGGDVIFTGQGGFQTDLRYPKEK